MGRLGHYHYFVAGVCAADVDLGPFNYDTIFIYLSKPLT